MIGTDYIGHMHPPTTFASVTFEGDLRLTVLQILSVDRLVVLEGVAEYLLVLNSEDNAALRATLLRHLDGRISDQLRQRLRIIQPQDMPRAGNGKGWHGQQAIKLGLADIVTTDTYVVLDAKNQFVRPFTVDEFFRDGTPVTVFSDTPPNWDKYICSSLRALDAYTDERASRMMPTTTPYVMITGEVQALISRLESRYGRPLLPAMRATKWGTEFFLYYAHLVSTYDVMPYVNSPSMTRTLYTIWPQDPGVALSLIREVTLKSVPMFGLHRNRLPQLSGDQRSAIRTMWKQHLLAEWEDADWFMWPWHREGEGD